MAENYSFRLNEAAEVSPSQPWVAPMEIGSNPFPGLRPFTPDESHLFFGREGQVDEVIVKLALNRIVTLMGHSGSGKSSLMNCGVIPALFGGFATESGSDWRVVKTRPGQSPIQNLAVELTEVHIKSGSIQDDDRAVYQSIFASVLRSGSHGLAEVSRYVQQQSGENILVVVDQFEELFRYRQEGHDEAVNEAALYVNLLLEAVQQRDVPVYVTLSMRSDFIGDCSIFPGLTQVINTSNYLVPQMTREQKKLAIEGPVAVGGGRISPRLVKRILNDVGESQDQLPIMQHALMRTWDYWVTNQDPGEPMDLRHYNAVGKISQALSLHANEAFDELTSREKEIAEVLFKAITDRSHDNLGVRRPAKIRLVAELAAATESEVIPVVERFRQAGRSFLMPGANVSLNADSLIELSHESMMRIWNRLSGWVDEEHESAQMYKRLSHAAAMYQIGKTSLWRPPDLQLALNWQKKQRPTRTWAQRYDEAFERAVVFLDTSRITYEAELRNQEMLQKRLLRRSRIVNVILAAFLVAAIALFFYGLTQQIKVEAKSREAELERDRAKEAQKKAETATKEAEKQRELAVKARKEVERQNKQLEEREDQLRTALEIAKQQRNLAFTNLNEANRQRDIARVARDSARTQYFRAEQNYERANRLLMLSIAQQLAAKAETMDDKELAGLFAMQGFLFHTDNEGAKYDPYIFRGLYTSLTKLYGNTYNAAKVPGNKRNKMFSLALASGSSFYTTGNDGVIYKGNYASKKITGEVGTNRFPNRVIAISPDEKYLVNASDSSFLQVFTLSESGSKPKIVDVHTGFVNDVEFLPDNSGFLSAGIDRTVRLTNPTNGQSRLITTLPVALKAIAVHPQSQAIIGVSSTGQIFEINLTAKSYSLLKDEAPNRVLSIAFHPTRPEIAYGMELLNEKGLPQRGMVKLMDTQKKVILKELTGHRAGVSSVEFSPDGELVAGAGYDRRLLLWVVDHEEDLPIVMDNNNGNVWDIAFTPDSRNLIASCNEGEVRVWPTDSRMLAELVCPKLTRNMTPEEWKLYVSRDEEKIPYESTCRSLLFKPL
ncbi:MAG: hypothetical protein ACK5DD_14200 [Cyclobacteriaceae bacterium]|jgi:energy-coupling factor transporter ATP-binding protein EcfA2